MPPKLPNYVSEERLVEYQEAFDSLDLLGKGKIQCEHLLFCLRKLGLMPADCELDDLIRSVDKDQTALSEGLSYEQFCQIASKKENDVYNEVDILNAFALFDSSARGYVTQEELTQLLCTRGDRLTPGEMAALIKTAEPTPEGHIDYETLVRSIMSQN